MLPNRNETVLALFHDPWQAQEALIQLREAGFTDFQVGIISSESDAVDTDSYVSEGAATGATVGAGAGLMWGMGVVAEALPAIGPVIAGGALATVLSSTVAGAAAVGLVGALIGIGVTRKDAETFEREIREGQTLVTVQAGTHDALAVSLLLQCGADRIQQHSLDADANPVNAPAHHRELAASPPLRREDATAGSE